MRIPRLVLGTLLAAGIGAAPAAAQRFNVQILSIAGSQAHYGACGIGGDYVFPLLAGGQVGEVWSVEVDLNTTPWTISGPSLVGTTCPGGQSATAGQTPGPGSGGGQGPRPGQTSGPAGGVSDSAGVADALPKIAFNRVFTFVCEADGFADGELSVTVSSIKGLGASIKDDFNAAVADQDGLVLLGKGVKVFSNGKKVDRGRLDDASSVTVKGKLLKTGQWHKDEDGNPVPTIRAKRVTITG